MDSIPKSVQPAFERKAHPYYMWEGIAAIPSGLEDLLSPEATSAIESAAASIQGRSPIYMAGAGTSYFAATAGAYVYRSVSRTPAQAWESFELNAYPPPDLSSSAVIGISHTGGTPDVVHAVTQAGEAGAATVAFTDVAGSALGRASGRVVASRLGLELALPKTRSYVASLMRLYRLALELGRRQGTDVSEWETALQNSPDTARSLLQTCEAQARRVASEQVGARRFVIAGGGPQWATAQEAALKLTEAALVSAAAWEIEEAVHGTWASTQTGDLVIVLAPGGPSFERAQRLITGMKTIDVLVWAITDRPDAVQGADEITALPAGVPELLQPLFAILPLYQFTYFLALAQGIHPDNMRLADPRYLKARTLMRTSLT